MENYYIYITYKDTEHYSLQLEGATVYIGAFPRGKRPCKIGEKMLIYEVWNKQSLGFSCVIKKINSLKDNRDDIYAQILKIFQYPLKYSDLCKESELLPDLHCFKPKKKELGTLLPISENLYSRIITLLNKKNKINTIDDYPEYNRKQFLEETFLEEVTLDTLIDNLQSKKNLIIQGAPGVGKTYIAKRLAYVVSGFFNPIDIKLIQFHQNYSYEDFIIGYKPSETGFELKPGVLFNFCRMAKANKTRNFILIIDEINRGNISKILGEAFMLLEASHRGEIIQLPENISFSIPDNLYIIGTMNTADRSISLLDSALHRRFSFYYLEPAYETNKFKTYLDSCTDELKAVINVIQTINDDISHDSSLGPGFVIGHSYFCNLVEDEINKKLMNIINYEIIPLLSEYWFDNPEKVTKYSKQLLECLNHDKS